MLRRRIGSHRLGTRYCEFPSLHIVPIKNAVIRSLCSKVTMKILSETKRKFRQHERTWRWVLNLRPAVSQMLGRAALSSEARRLLKDLNRDGIAVTTSEALLDGGPAYHELSDGVEKLEAESAEKIESARARAGEASAIGEKTFLYFLLGEKPTVDSESVFCRFAVQEQILGIANAYMGMQSQLRYYNVWHTLANPGAARESQLWHRDRDDFLTCKVFVYLNDVGDGAGPFTYAKGTHPKGHNHAEPPFTLEGSVKRSDDNQMSVVAPKDTWVKATGSRGTIIFADTRGYHKGGEARSSDRIMYTCMFVSTASEVREMMTPPALRLKMPSSRVAARALSRYV